MHLTVFNCADCSSDAKRSSFSTLVASAISQAGDAPLPLLDEDPDDWLNVDSDNFENMLQQTFHGGKTASDPNSMDVDRAQKEEQSPEERLASEQASRLKTLAEKVEQFVDGEGDMDGAKFMQFVFRLPYNASADDHLLETKNFRTKSSAMIQCLTAQTLTLTRP